MRITLLADIHANLEALEACLADAARRGVDRHVFLGDIVGYGADPQACLDIVRSAVAQGALVVRGNHDDAVAGTRFRLNEAAGAAADWTRALLADDLKAFLADLPLSVVEDDRLYVHASAFRPMYYPYIHGTREAADSLMATEHRLTVCGHVHRPALYHISTTGKILGFTPMTGTPIPLVARRRWLAVMGAVGQPRDGDPTAAYGILDTAKNELTYVRVAYDIETAAAKIRAAGLPDVLWKRLALGQ